MTAILVQAASFGNSGDNSFGNTVSLPVPATTGNLIVIVAGNRSDAAPYCFISGFTIVGSSVSRGSTPDSHELHTKIAAGGEQTFVNTAGGSNSMASGIVAEFSGVGTISDFVFDSLIFYDGSSNATMPTVTPSSGKPAIVIGTLWKSISAFYGGPPTGYADYGDSGYAGFGNRHRLVSWYKSVASTSGSYGGNTTATFGGSENYGTISTLAITFEPPLDCNPRIIDNFNRVISITDEFDSFNRSNYGPVWESNNLIRSGLGSVIFTDNMNRSVGIGLGISSDTTTTYVQFPGSTGIDIGSVNGTFYQMPLNGAWWWTGYPQLSANILYTAQFDFLTPNNTIYFDLVEFDQIISGGSNWLTFFVQGNFDTTATVTAAGGSGTVTATGTISASTWYTAKMEFTLNGTIPKAVKVKFWERATSEPSWMGTGNLTATTVTPYPPTAYFPSLYVGNGLSTTSATGIDNLSIVRGSPSSESSIYSVDGSSVYLNIDLAGDPNNLHLETLTLPFELWMVDNPEYSIRFKTDQIPTGSTQSKYYDIMFSVSGSSAGPIVAKARVSSSATYGKIYLGASSVTKTDWIANTWYTILIKRTNANASVFMWADSDSQPTTAQVILTANYSWPFDTAAIFTASLDWTEISDGAFASTFDNFNRIASNLGTASPSGALWEWSSGAGYSVLTTDGSSAMVPFTSTERVGYSYFQSSIPTLLKQQKFIFKTRFRQSALVSSGSDGIGWQWYGTSYAQRIRIDISSGASGQSAVNLSLNGSVNITNVIGPILSANDWFVFKFDFQSGSYGRIKFWKESDGEPSAWLINLADPGTNLSDVILWDWYNELQNSHTFTREYDYIDIYNPSFVLRLDDLIAGCIETAIILPTPSAGFGVYTRDRMLLSIRASFTDDNLYNHSLVIGTGNKSQIVVSEVKDENSLSPTRIAAIGDRVFRYESDQISTQAAADKAAIKNYLANCLISEDIDLEAICNPAFEGNDMIAVQELTFSELDQKFRLRAFTVPLSTSRQTFKLSRVISI